MTGTSIRYYYYRRCMHLGRIVKDKDELHIAFRDKVLSHNYFTVNTRYKV